MGQSIPQLLHPAASLVQPCDHVHMQNAPPRHLLPHNCCLPAAAAAGPAAGAAIQQQQAQHGSPVALEVELRLTVHVGVEAASFWFFKTAVACYSAVAAGQQRSLYACFVTVYPLSRLFVSCLLALSPCYCSCRACRVTHSCCCCCCLLERYVLARSSSTGSCKAPPVCVSAIHGASAAVSLHI
jgi:hypothetical protein